MKISKLVQRASLAIGASLISFAALAATPAAGTETTTLSCGKQVTVSRTKDTNPPKTIAKATVQTDSVSRNGRK